MTHDTPQLRDLLYLDFNKAASIWSQFEGGLLERVSITDDSGKTRTAGTKFGVPLAGANLNVDYLEKHSTLESRTLHHDVLNRVEQRLRASGLVTDLLEMVKPDESSAEIIRNAVGGRPYLHAAGYAVIEDYRRALSISEKLNDLIGFAMRSAQENIKKSPAYKELEETVAAAKDAADQIQDRNQRAARREIVGALQRKLEELLKTPAPQAEQWVIEGIRLWMNTFMPNRINLRIFPFPECPSFQVLCNLKRDCFVDSDLEHLLYGYGSRPTVPLAVFGLVTSLPQADQPAFDPMSEFSQDDGLAQKVPMEKAYRDLFAKTEDLEASARFSRYPNITVHPIAVYRSFSVEQSNA